MHTRVGKSRSLAAAHWTASNLQQQLTANNRSNLQPTTACSSNLQPATTNDSSSSLQQQQPAAVTL
jgi:hypothetical protein